MHRTALALALLLTAAAIPAALAQESAPPDAGKSDSGKSDSGKPAAGPAPLVVYFDTGSAAVRAQDLAILDHASRLYRDGKPIVMIVSGATDRTGSAQANLVLSQRRADSVVQGLVSRGIPAERFQVLAKGVTEPADPGAQSPDSAADRRVEITWR